MINDFRKLKNHAYDQKCLYKERKRSILMSCCLKKHTCSQVCRLHRRLSTSAVQWGVSSHTGVRARWILLRRWAVLHWWGRTGGGGGGVGNRRRCEARGAISATEQHTGEMTDGQCWKLFKCFNLIWDLLKCSIYCSSVGICWRFSLVTANTWLQSLMHS